jgi:hypothetical protein
MPELKWSESVEIELGFARLGMPTPEWNTFGRFGAQLE